MAAARSLVEEEFLGSLAGLPSQQLRERLAAKYAALQEQAASLAAMDLPEDQVRADASLAPCHLSLNKLLLLLFQQALRLRLKEKTDRLCASGSCAYQDNRRILHRCVNGPLRGVADVHLFGMSRSSGGVMIVLLWLR